MLRIQFNNGSPLRTNLPRAYQKQEILELAQAFVAYENTRPVENRTPYTAQIETAVADALAAQEIAIDEEANRKSASEALKRTREDAKTLLRQIRSLLAGRFTRTPEQAQAWGFMVRQTGRSAGLILMPKTLTDVRTCLNEYIATEQARPELEQFIEPPLAEVIAVRDSLMQQRQLRNQSRQTRLRENGRSSLLIQQIREELRKAMGYLMLVEFNSQPDRTLSQWGFEVVARTTRPAPEETPEPAEEESLEDPT